jgi:hypothetical protein
VKGLGRLAHRPAVGDRDQPAQRLDLHLCSFHIR